MNLNLLRRSDSYKYTHWKQYPPGTQHIYSYLEARGGRFEESVFFGLQYYLREYLAGVRVTQEHIEDAERFCNAHLGPNLFHRAMWEHILNAHGGRLPVRIKAVPEGTVVPVRNVLMTIENTDPLCFPLTNFLETILLKVWYPITVATLSREIKKLIKRYLDETGDPSGLPFKLHDFGYRGASSEETAAIGGASHLVNFMGTDTVLGIQMLEEYYGATSMPAFSIPAAEHSTITSWGEEGEEDAYRNMLRQFPEGLVAVVSDSYDIFNAVENIWGGHLKHEVLNRAGTLVIRPDSGTPKDIVLACVQKLAARFGAQENGKGYAVLSPKVRVIQGDGINIFSIDEILLNLKRHGFSADNVAFGMGGALIQQCNRDTMQFAMKASCATVNGRERDVFKRPATDTGKVSKAGRLALVRGSGGALETRRNPLGSYPGDLLKTVFENGEIIAPTTLDEVRERAAL